MIDPHMRPILQRGDLRLRAPVVADVEARLALGRSPAIVKMFGVADEDIHPMTLAQAEDWVEAQLREPLAFVIEYQGRTVGALRLHSVDKHDRRANMAIALLDDALLDQGIGTAAMGVLLDHGFGAMGLNRVTVRVIDFNERALAAYGKLGFVREGRERQSARVGDVYHDDIIMGLLASEWRA